MTGIITLILSLWAFLNWNEINLLKRIVPKPDGPYALGANLLFYYGGLPHWRLLTFCFIGLSTVLGFLFSSKSHIENLCEPLKIEVRLFVPAFAGLLFCFAVNTNYDYRAIFFLPMVPFLWSMAFEAEKRLAIWFARVVLIVLPIVLWSEWLISLLPSLFSKSGLAGLATVPRGYRYAGTDVFQYEWILRMLEHALTWVIMLLCAFLSTSIFRVWWQGLTVRRLGSAPTPV